MNIQRLVLLDDTPAARPVRLPDKDAVRYEVFKEPHNAVDDSRICASGELSGV
jgi:hypothetical protein